MGTSDDARLAVPVIGQWEEVRPEQSMFGRPEQIAAAAAVESDEEAAEVNPVTELKYETERRQFAEEDLEVREKEFFQKRSITEGKPASFSGFAGRKKAAGIL